MYRFVYAIGYFYKCNFFSGKNGPYVLWVHQNFDIFAAQNQTAHQIPRTCMTPSPMLQATNDHGQMNIGMANPPTPQLTGFTSHHGTITVAIPSPLVGHNIPNPVGDNQLVVSRPGDTHCSLMTETDMKQHLKDKGDEKKRKKKGDRLSKFPSSDSKNASAFQPISPAGANAGPILVQNPIPIVPHSSNTAPAFPPPQQQVQRPDSVELNVESMVIDEVKDPEESAKVESLVQELAEKVNGGMKAVGGGTRVQAQNALQPEKIMQMNNAVQVENLVAFQNAVQVQNPLQFHNAVQVQEAMQIQNPVKVQHPVQVRQPVHVHQPVAVQNAFQCHEVVEVKHAEAVNDPRQVHQPVQLQQPVHVQQPVVIHQPVHVQQPVQVQQPVLIQQPVPVQNADQERIQQARNALITSSVHPLSNRFVGQLSDMLSEKLKTVQNSNEVPVVITSKGSPVTVENIMATKESDPGANDPLWVDQRRVRSLKRQIQKETEEDDSKRMKLENPDTEGERFCIRKTIFKSPPPVTRSKFEDFELAYNFNRNTKVRGIGSSLKSSKYKHVSGLSGFNLKYNQIVLTKNKVLAISEKSEVIAEPLEQFKRPEPAKNWLDEYRKIAAQKWRRQRIFSTDSEATDTASSGEDDVFLPPSPQEIALQSSKRYSPVFSSNPRVDSLSLLAETACKLKHISGKSKTTPKYMRRKRMTILTPIQEEPEEEEMEHDGTESSQETDTAEEKEQMNEYYNNQNESDSESDSEDPLGVTRGMTTLLK